jgi:DNA-binding response OmpR family regulator
MKDPRRRRPDRRTDAPASQGSKRKTARIRVARSVLVAEPDAALGELYRSALESDGWAVDVVTDGRTALARAAASPPGVLLLSTVPDLPPMTVLERLRNDESTRHLAVIVLTNSRDEADLPRLRHLGAIGWLIKSRPMRASLSETITGLLERRISGSDRRES